MKRIIEKIDSKVILLIGLHYTIQQTIFLNFYIQIIGFIILLYTLNENRSFFVLINYFIRARLLSLSFERQVQQPTITNVRQIYHFLSKYHFYWAK